MKAPEQGQTLAEISRLFNEFAADWHGGGAFSRQTQRATWHRRSMR